MSLPSNVRIRLTVLGCGDAFGSGGRLQTCFHAETGGNRFLIDCGATASIGMKRFGIDPLLIDTILITHFHGDHIAGLPFLLIEARFSHRSTPLTIAGPPGVQERVEAAMQALFRGVRTDPPFEIRFLEYPTEGTLRIGSLDVSAFPVVHSPEALPHALRVTTAERVIAFSGDTQWTPVLADVARAADLFICECAGFEAPVPVHLDYATLLLHRPALDCRRMLITHMGPAVLANRDIVATGLDAILAEDGLEMDVR